MRFQKACILLFFFIGFLSSCSKDYNYEFQIINNTTLILDTVVVDFSNSDERKFSIDTYETSEVFNLNYKQKAANKAFGNTLLYISVSSYSNSNSSFSNACGINVTHELICEETLNIIKINKREKGSSTCEHDIFEIKVNR